MASNSEPGLDQMIAHGATEPGGGTALSSEPSARQPSRIGKRAVTTHLSPDGHRAVRQLALDLDTTVQELVRRGLSQLLLQHGRQPLAQDSKTTAAMRGDDGVS
jgi:hypothetical protein